MSAKSDPRPVDRHGFKLLDRTTADNADVSRRWERKFRHFEHIKHEVEPQRQQLIAARGAVWRRPSL